MNRMLKITYLVVFFVVLALPSLHYFGAKESWHKIWGWERIPENPSFTLKSFADRSYQTTLTEHFSKAFFLRNTFYTTARQINEIANFGLFHSAGYAGGTIEGKAFDDRHVGVIFEDPYAKYHLGCERPFNPKRYDSVIALLREIDAFCRTNGADFVFQSMPDKLQAYPEYLPDWMKWVWNYENFPIQTHMAKLCEANGVKAIDGLALFSKLRAETKEWLYPPGGTHLTCLASARLAEEIVRRVNAAGRIRLEVNPLVRVVEKPDGNWSVDNDISELLNMWYNRHIDMNVHYFPEFAHEPKVLNAGSAFIIGDCYRNQMAQIFNESGLFAKEKILQSKRQGQKPEDFKAVIGDLKLVVLTFQSFNTGDLDKREAELREIFTALKTAHEKFKRNEK